MDNRIERVVVLAAPVERVWQALTDHEAFGTWFRAAIDGPFRVGEISTGRMTEPGFEDWPWLARIEAMERPHHFAFRWPHGTEADVNFATEPTTLVEFRLEPDGGGTRLMIIESGFEAMPDPRRLEALRSNSQGWDEQARRISAYVG